MTTTKDGLIHFLNDPDILAKIQELANMLTSPKDIATILQVDEDVFLNQLRERGSDVYKAFNSGYLRREIEIRKKNLEPVDVDSSEFTLRQLINFKSTITIQLYG